jgi:hypothetical protein
MTDRVHLLQLQDIGQSDQMACMVPDGEMRGGRSRSIARPPHPDYAEPAQGRTRRHGREPIRKDASVNQQQWFALTTLGILDLCVRNLRGFDGLRSVFHRSISSFPA